MKSPTKDTPKAKVSKLVLQLPPGSIASPFTSIPSTNSRQLPLLLLCLVASCCTCLSPAFHLLYSNQGAGRLASVPILGSQLAVISPHCCQRAMGSSLPPLSSPGAGITTTPAPDPTHTTPTRSCLPTQQQHPLFVPLSTSPNEKNNFNCFLSKLTPYSPHYTPHTLPTLPTHSSSCRLNGMTISFSSTPTSPLLSLPPSGPNPVRKRSQRTPPLPLLPLLFPPPDP